MKITPLPQKDHAIPLFSAGETVYMVDFDEADQRNACRRITSASMVTEAKKKSNNVFFFLKEK